VIAVPHSTWVERPLACVVPKPEHCSSLTAADILDFLRPRVAKFWLPDAVVFLEAVPKTSVSKFDKKVLRERFKDWHRRSSQSSSIPHCSFNYEPDKSAIAPST